MRKIISSLIIITICISLFTSNVFADSGSVETFVTSLYEDCLDRNPDAEGLNYWVSRLTDRSISGKECAYGFFYSDEFLSKANSMSDTQLITIYYKVFLNRTPDFNGMSYWLNEIKYTDNDVSILFTGFADSIEFSNKCQSYGIVSGDSISVPTLTRTNNIEYSSLPTSYSEALSYTATSPEHLDAIWNNLGYETYYIDLGNGQTQKCYAKFYTDDVVNHINQVNAYRTQNGCYPLTPITDINDPRVQETRLRAVEICYTASHAYPSRMGVTGRPYRIASRTGENFCAGYNLNGAFEWWQNSPSHNANMLNTTYHHAMTAVGCDVVFVNPDGVSVSYRSNAASRGLANSMDCCTVQLFWS